MVAGVRLTLIVTSDVALLFKFFVSYATINKVYNPVAIRSSLRSRIIRITPEYLSTSKNVGAG